MLLTKNTPNKIKFSLIFYAKKFNECADRLSFTNCFLIFIKSPLNVWVISLLRIYILTEKNRLHKSLMDLDSSMYTVYEENKHKLSVVLCKMYFWNFLDFLKPFRLRFFFNFHNFQDSWCFKYISNILRTHFFHWFDFQLPKLFSQIHTYTWFSLTVLS